MKSVAELAGVSTVTVDRVLKGRPGVHPRTKQRVWAAALKLDYRVVAESVPGAAVILLPSGPNAFIDALAQSLITRAFDMGVHLRVERLSLSDPDTYGARLHLLAHQASSSGMPAVALVAPDHPAIREGIRVLADAGAAIFTLLADLSAAPRSAYIGMENRSVGRLAGQLMDRLSSARPGTLGVIIGSASYRNHEEREAGFCAYAKERNRQIEIKTVRLSDDEPASAAAAARDLLATTPDLKGLYNVGAGTSAVADALTAAGKAADVVLIGHELTDDTRAGLISGAIDVIIDQSIHGTATALLEAICGSRTGVAAKVAPINPYLIFRENLPQ
jgi:LacI family transcriptional regulator